jgi:hypothetical protein
MVFSVKSGSVTNIITGKIYNEGDAMTLGKGEVYEIYYNEESFIYIITAKSKNLLPTSI